MGLLRRTLSYTQRTHDTSGIVPYPGRAAYLLIRGSFQKPVTPALGLLSQDDAGGRRNLRKLLVIRVAGGKVHKDGGNGTQAGVTAETRR